jgi:hypothetical protein
VIRTILDQVDRIVEPWNEPLVDWEAVIPVDWLAAANNNCAE